MVYIANLSEKRLKNTPSGSLFRALCDIRWRRFRNFSEEKDAEQGAGVRE